MNLINFFSLKGTIKGGISTTSELKYAKNDDCHIRYFDVTNLYGKTL